MKQQGAEWLKWRAGGIGSSEAAVILAVSPYQTPYELWELRTDRRQPTPMTGAMERGKEREPYARLAYEVDHEPMEPACYEHATLPWMRASLDGITLDGTTILEIKCPGSTAYWGMNNVNLIPPHYFCQVMHQLCVSRAKRAHFFVWHPEHGGFLRIVERDEVYIAKLIEAEQKFWTCIQQDVPPPLTDRDRLVRDDKEWLTLAEEYRRAEAVVSEWERKKEAAKLALIEQADGRARVEGGGILLTRYNAKGTVDYSRVPELMGVDLEPYRKAGRSQVRLTLQEG